MAISSRTTDFDSLHRGGPPGRVQNQTPLLHTLGGPRDLDALTPDQLVSLAQEVREFLVRTVTQTGGHLGANLGVVELTIALHRVFDSPRTPILFDTGHQSYVHKLLTGRQDFSRLRARDGLSGYPSREESRHDFVENSHASAVLGWADGMARAKQLQGSGEHVVAVVGDGALTGGMAWEALNNIAASPQRPLIIVVNDNGRSYAPTVGGLANHLAELRENREKVATWRDGPYRTPLVTEPETGDQRNGASSLPSNLFEALGLSYLGPVDGHDLTALESALRNARTQGGAVVVHCVTRKGCGYAPAEECEEDRFHAIGVVHPATGIPVKTPHKDWTSIFAEEMVALGHERREIVAITAAMLHPVGLSPFASQFPQRVFDVGLAEQHAVVMAAGLATAGLHPIFAVYATFLNRAFDQVLMDVALHRIGVTFVLDRAGITGPDGPTHHGMWDLSILQAVPHLRLAAPRDAEQLRKQLRESVAVDDAPTVVRYPKGAVGPIIAAAGQINGMDVLLGAPDSIGTRPGMLRADVLLVSIGAMAPISLEAAAILAASGISSTVVDPRWVKPVNTQLPALAAEHRMVVTIEDHGCVGGAGSMLAQAMREAAVSVTLHDFAIPQRFLDHSTREELMDDAGLTGPAIACRIAALLAAQKEADR
ncbi:1-deoxy-D-xylulose-5-phosphate synthase [Streptomyces sp. 3211]|uniref:1-deoxy-D-xylulose-5-phosphate synthase n=1 Tax=Streptomyces sp. 3211 TaxID=1964449 RepID=UPI0009A4EBAF|nr:1-deoxy-D-xylulose-5-phosphate synthase [Streptomyces sp. 3211]